MGKNVQNTFFPNLFCINLKIETSSFFITGGPYGRKKSLIFESSPKWQVVCAVNFHSVAVKDISCTIRLLAKFEFPNRASNKIRLNCQLFKG